MRDVIQKQKLGRETEQQTSRRSPSRAVISAFVDGYIGNKNFAREESNRNHNAIVRPVRVDFA